MGRIGAARRILLRPVALHLRRDRATIIKDKISADDCLEMVFLPVGRLVDPMRPLAAVDFDGASHVQRRESVVVGRVDLDGSGVVRSLRPRGDCRRRSGIPLAIRSREAPVEEDVLGVGRAVSRRPVGANGRKAGRCRNPRIVAGWRNEIPDRQLRGSCLSVDAVEPGGKRYGHGRVHSRSGIHLRHNLDVHEGRAGRDRRRSGKRLVGLAGNRRSAYGVGDT